MEEADKILVSQLRSLGVNSVGSLRDFDANSFIGTIIVCFERIGSMLDEADNFMNFGYLKKQNLAEATHRYKVC